MKRAALVLACLFVAAPAAAESQAPAWLGPPTFAPRFLGPKPPREPVRIISVAPSVTEIVFAVGAGSRVIGVSRFDDYPLEVASIPKVGGFLDPNPEVIIALKPDLVIAAPNASNRAVLDRLAKLGIPVLVVPGNRLADLFHATRAIADALGGDSRAEGERTLREMRTAVEQLRGVARRPSPRVAVVYDRNPMILAGPSSFMGTVLDVLGAKNVVQIDVEYPSYSREQLLLDAPDVIVDAAMVDWTASMTSSVALGRIDLKGPHPAAQFWSRWSALPAVRNGQLYGVRGSSLLRASPRLLGGMRELAAILGPQSGARSISK